jgi:pyruvate-ferredoxin/flavodoxin oxidoreductase
MPEKPMVTLDANEGVALVAHRLSEIIAIYPITPSSPMGEWADEWSSHGKTNIWGTVPQVTEMQSEAGAAGAVHGALQGGALTTTFTASQGLLLMIPNMYKIAGELTSFTMHVSARTVAAQALSIFGDHSDVMACRQTGFALLASGSVQEAHDLACIAHAATLGARLPFLHFFDGFRTSHELGKIAPLTDEDLQQMMDEGLVKDHRGRALNPDRPFIRGTAQNPDTFFQAREAANPFYLAGPEIVLRVMDRFFGLTGRRYNLFDFVGDPEAERVIVVMGSATDVVHETVEWLTGRGEKVGVVKVRLYRPFSTKDFVSAFPATVKSVAVLDRTKEPGAVGEPLYLDALAAFHESVANTPKIIGGRYGLSSKEFNPAMVKGIFDELKKETPKNHFTIGIRDDVTHTSIDYDPDFDIEGEDVVRAVFFGLGADGTVSANKNSIKIIGEETPNYAQGYFVYDSKKSGGITTSHLRFGPRPIRSSYLIKKAGFVACHQFVFTETMDMLDYARPGAVFLLNSPYGPEAVWDHLPQEMQEQIIEKKLKFYIIDAYEVARKTDMGQRINTIMQTCFFAISGVLPRQEAIDRIKQAIEKSYGKKGAQVVQKNFEAVDETLANLFPVTVPEKVTATHVRRPIIAEEAPDFVKRVEAIMMAGQGDSLPVSAMPVDGTWPLGTTRFEKRNLALEIPIWDPELCIQCGKCALICPHSTIRIKAYWPEALKDAPPTFKSAVAKGRELSGKKFTVQVAPEDCTGCGLCVITCPAKDKTNPKHKAIDMAAQREHKEAERLNWAFYLKVPGVEADETRVNVKNSQLREPLFEFSGACAGCGETQYIKLLTQLFGQRTLIANATGCSSIYGGNQPTTPYTTDREGYGPAWSNSLFEDNAEFGLGLRLALDKHIQQAGELLRALAPQIGDQMVHEILKADQSTEKGICLQRERIRILRQAIGELDLPEAGRLFALADYLIRKDVWIIGGDGWAYDIGYGGLDHVLALGRKVNILVLDTEVYSNTGGQQSKATPLGAVAKFAAAGKSVPKKDLGLMAMTYGRVYVAAVAIGANDQQTVKAFIEAESFPGPSLIIAYAHCIAHGYDLAYGGKHQKLAVDSGYWPLYRFDPRRTAQNLNPLQLDSGPPKTSLEEYIYTETRYRMLQTFDPERAAALLAGAKEAVERRFRLYEQLSRLNFDTGNTPSSEEK